MTLVSVVVPTYNRLSLLQQTVASVQAQTHRHFELVIVDDGSNDGKSHNASNDDADDFRRVVGFGDSWRSRW